MSNREKMLEVYRNQNLDDVIWGIYSRYLVNGKAERDARNAGLGIIDFFPPVSLLAPPWHLKEGYISEVKNADFKISYKWENGKLYENRVYVTPVGEISQIIVKDLINSTEWIEKSYIETIEDYKTLKFVIKNSILLKQDQIAGKIEKLGEDGVILGRLDRSPFQKLLIELVNPERFLTDVFLNPEPIEELLYELDIKLSQQVDMALDSSVSVIWQPDNITSEMTSPDFFDKYCLPFYNKVGQKCKEAGKIYVIHIDGKTHSIKDSINKACFDVVESFSLPVMGGDLEIDEALKIWKNKLIFPNFPASLCLKSEDEINHSLDELEHKMKNRPPMIQLSEDFNIEKYNFLLKVLTRRMKRDSN